MTSPEQQPKGAEVGSADLREFAAEQAEKLASKQEKEHSPEADAGERATEARRATHEVFAREAGREGKSGGEPTATAVRQVSTSERKQSYKRTMARIQREMSPLSRGFSKVIHQPVVEDASQTIGSTLARPDAILAGSATAFVFTLGMYLIARTYGITLSGFETIAGFVLGWVLGIIFDYARVGLMNNRPRK
jgi:hypothetical protein